MLYRTSRFSYEKRNIRQSSFTIDNHILKLSFRANLLFIATYLLL